MNLDDLYHIADVENIEIIPFPLPKTKSLSIQTDDFDCYIGMDDSEMPTNAEKKIRLADELGHCTQSAFYNRWSSCDLVSRHEYRANRWACEQLIPKEEMEIAMKKGYCEVWQLAEYFDVTEELVRKACWIYFDKIF